MPLPLLLLVLALGGYRLSRLVVKDDFPLVRAPREWVKAHGPEWAAELVTCHWCASGWITLGLVAAAARFGSVPLPVLVWPAVWAAAAWIVHHERTNVDTRLVSARVVLDRPGDAASRPPAADELRETARRLREQWGPTGLVLAALEGLPRRQRRAVLDDVAEWQGRRVDHLDTGTPTSDPDPVDGAGR